MGAIVTVWSVLHKLSRFLNDGLDTKNGLFPCIQFHLIIEKAFPLNSRFFQN